MAIVTIGELARRAGLRPSALRFYERAGLLAPPRRVAGQRRYDERTLDTLGVIRLAQAAGFTLAEIRALLHDFAPGTPPAARWQQLVPQRIAELDAQIARAQRMRGLLTHIIECSCDTLEACAQAASTQP